MTMALITWLGEDGLKDINGQPQYYEIVVDSDGNQQRVEVEGPRRNVWKNVGHQKKDVVFHVGKPVEIDDPHVIKKAKANMFFRVEESKKG